MSRMLRRLLALVLSFALTAPASAACRGTLYLTIDTGTMVPAERIATALRQRHIHATFFIANELTANGKTALDPVYAPFWRSLVADGHAFGSHTWRHWYFRGDVGADRVRYVKWASSEQVLLDHDAFCRELAQVRDAFGALTGKSMAPLWRAPGGHTTPTALRWGPDCGFARHVGWSPAGFLGDELPADKYSNQTLLTRALAGLRDGDVMMMHLGIRDRKQPFVEVFEPLLDGLLAKGFCFKTLAEGAP
jgi:peptidoglycan/xylan/chitin deacetylase (PgdA/CDA1 family)